LVVHASEWRRVGNTGHLIRLAVDGAEICVHGRRHRTISDELTPSAASPKLVLYPGRGAAALTAEYIAELPRPITLLVPDGNWNQTSRMLTRLPLLRRARPVRLAGPSLDLPCVRRNHGGDRRSTFEAIAQALGIIEGIDIERKLLDFFRRVLSRKNAYGVPQSASESSE
jgi:DTW domain-containing protein YfiP